MSIVQTLRFNAVPGTHIFASLFVCLAGISNAHASQIDIEGPFGSEGFGHNVVVLPNGNIVASNPNESVSMGAVYLLSPTGIVLSKLTGSVASDSIGSGGVVVLSNGNFLVISPNWNGTSFDAGAVTWVNGETGLDGQVSASNSLVGATAQEHVGESGVVALSNGNYVVPMPHWDNGALMNVGAVTFGNGNSGVIGPISQSNSLLGSNAFDSVGSGGIVALANGNFVVCSPAWSNSVGAATWVDGSAGMSGTLSSANSLVGSISGDGVGSEAIALVDGDYVVTSPSWNEDHGAATWANGNTGISGSVSSSNSLVGESTHDRVGSGGALALTNGNFVVLSPSWNQIGAATWVDGAIGRVGVLDGSASLIRTGSNLYGSVALSNGNYVISSPNWGDIGATTRGAATWVDGSTGITGDVPTANSLLGSSTDDRVGENIVALSNGSYVVVSGYWDNGSIADAGAVTWCGASGCSGTVSPSNSLVGTTEGDTIGIDESENKVFALTNGNYVVLSPSWHNGSIEAAGAATFGDGATGLIGVVSPTNSLVGTHPSDQIGLTGGVALDNGNYVIGSPLWDNDAVSSTGAVTWGSGIVGVAGTISTSNSLTGTSVDEEVGGGIKAFSGGYFAALSAGWDSLSATNAGAATIAPGDRPLLGQISASNSVLGNNSSSFGTSMSVDFDSFREQLVVGRPADNMISIRQLSLFESGFD